MVGLSEDTGLLYMVGLSEDRADLGVGTVRGHMAAVDDGTENTGLL